MVRRGEYLERSVAIPAGARMLEGLYHRGKRGPAVLIAPYHPMRGGSMDAPVIAELAWAITRAGHPTLRFNYHGVGGSPGSFSEPEVLDDVLAAANHLEASVSSRVADDGMAAVGLGLGAELVLRMAVDSQAQISPLVLVEPEGPPPDALVGAYRGELVVIWPQHYGDLDVDGLRRQVDWAGARWVEVAGAQRGFDGSSGLATTGRIVSEILSPPALLDLG